MKLYSFGEILFDTFEDTHTLGGAPLNVAAHYKQLGGESAIISALGNDGLGQEAFQSIEKLGVDASMISILEKVPTGIAEITMNGKDADYEFNYPAAWDRIDLSDDDIDAINENPFILYFGSLALRSTESFLTLDSILASTSPEEVFVDINLRKDFYSDSILGFCLDNATILKINEDEINVICDMAGIENCDAEELFGWLLENTAIHTLLITRGKHGSDCFTTEGKVHENCSDVKVVDTVGAGDSLSAAYLFYRYEKGLKAAEALHKATAVADYVVGNKGAIPLYSPEMFS